MTEKEKMIAGKMYDAYDGELVELREHCRKEVNQFNEMDASEGEARQSILKKLLGSCGKNVYMLDVQFDYGFNMYIGDEFSSNFNFVVLDCAPVHIGNNVLVGPNVTIATPIHPLLPFERNFQYDEAGNRHLYEYAAPITIGNDVWISSNVTILPGVEIGDGCVIGAGSVVTKSLPPYSLAVGTPCRVVREITEKDSVKHLF